METRNWHARRSGKLEDQNKSKKGVQVRGGDYTLDNDDDPSKVVIAGYEQPGPNDKVRIAGNIPYTRDKACRPMTGTASRASGGSSSSIPTDALAYEGRRAEPGEPA